MAKAVADGFVAFNTAHDYSSLPEAAEGWILGHYDNIPPHARPARDNLPAFCAFFSTYMTNSFDLVPAPGKRLFSPQAHCFCPMCSWLVDAPNLRTKKVRPNHKRRAEKMRVDALQQLATEHRLWVAPGEIERLLTDRDVWEDASLLAYALDMRQREQGIGNGPAVLALWRGFAWQSTGAPKPNFRFTAQMICDARDRLHSLLSDLNGDGTRQVNKSPKL